MSRGDGPSLCQRYQAALATMAALSVHMAQLGTPILDDPRYFNIENYQPAEGLGHGLHLHARRIALPLRNGKRLDVSAPLPITGEATAALISGTRLIVYAGAPHGLSLTHASRLNYDLEQFF